jgi:hypothetical protein
MEQLERLKAEGVERYDNKWSRSQNNVAASLQSAIRNPLMALIS